MAKALTLAEFQERISAKYDNEYSLIFFKALAVRAPIILRHSCGHEFESTFQSFVNDSKGKCKVCYLQTSKGRQKALTEDELIKRLINTEYNYISGFINTKKKALFRHSCGHEFESLPRDIYSNKSGCPKCANKNRGKYQVNKNYLELLLSVEDGNEYKWLDKFRDNKTLTLIKHLTCNNEYKVRPNDFQQGYRCPFCSEKFPTESKSVKHIIKRLTELNISFAREFTDSRCRFKNVLRFDFAIDLPDSRKLLIEFDGKQHFHPLINEDVFELQIERDLVKNQFCKIYSKEYVLERISYKENVEDKLVEILLKHNLVEYCRH